MNVTFSSRLKMDYDQSLFQTSQNRIEQYQQGPYAKKWEGCQAFKDHQSMLQSAAKPEGVIIGVPPAVHGKGHHIWTAMSTT